MELCRIIAGKGKIKENQLKIGFTLKYDII